jgi:hypothetical protein
MPTHRRIAASVALGVALIVLPFLPLTGGSASADTIAYELYCPGTPVGNLVMNGVHTTGTVVPASPTMGQRFTISNFQTTIPLSIDIVGAAAALGNSVISGKVRSSVHMVGARLTNVKIAHQAYSVPIPSPLPESALIIAARTRSIGPFRAKRSGITVSMNPATRLTMNISGSNLKLNCQSYPDNTLPTGIVGSGPRSKPITPVVAQSVS